MRSCLERDELVLNLLNDERWRSGVEMRQHPLQLIRGPLATADAFEQPLIPQAFNAVRLPMVLLGTGLSTMLVARPASYQTWSEMSSVWLPQVTNKSRMDTPSNHPGTAMVHLGECQIRKMLGSVS
jgi:hypothetical protein